MTLRTEIENRPGMFARIATAIAEAGGDLGAVDIVRAERGRMVRDITVNARDERHEREIVQEVRSLPGVRVQRVLDRTFSVHVGGKIEIRSKRPVRGRDDLSKVYTPGVARVCMDIREHPEHAWRYTVKGNMVAVVSDGTAVLGLGNIGPLGALPVMEGKCMIFKEFAGIDAVPVVLSTTEPDEIVAAVKAISPTFGGINLEDISGPRCFDIERRLREALDIPVIHDDQHGTAVVTLAALMNVGRLTKKSVKTMRIVISGAGAAGLATARLLVSYGVRDIIVCDSRGIIYKGRKTGMDPHKAEMARKLNPRNIRGTVSDAMRGAHVFIGLSKPGAVSVDDIKLMAKERVFFALANPEPEVAPEDAAPLCRIVATGRSDYPNQINNMLSYPGIFRGLLDVRATGVNDAVKFAAAEAIANMVRADELHEDYVIPSIFDHKVAEAVSKKVAEAARKTGLARKHLHH